MKSAYELALERLNQSSGPQRTLTADQKQRMAELDKKYDARAASARLSLEARLAQAASFEEAEKIRTEMAAELQSIETQRQREKDAIWEEPGDRG